MKVPGVRMVLSKESWFKTTDTCLHRTMFKNLVQNSLVHARKIWLDIDLLRSLFKSMSFGGNGLAAGF